MKYSIRNMIIVAILAIFVAWFGRVQYLNRYAVFHEQEMYKILDLNRPRGEAETKEYHYHARMARNYHRAKNVPWKIVDDSIHYANSPAPAPNPPKP